MIVVITIIARAGKMTENNECCMCGENYGEFGNNAEPVASGRCCDTCNFLVIEERIRRMKK